MTPCPGGCCVIRSSQCGRWAHGSRRTQREDRPGVCRGRKRGAKTKCANCNLYTFQISHEYLQNRATLLQSANYASFWKIVPWQWCCIASQPTKGPLRGFLAFFFFLCIVVFLSRLLIFRSVIGHCVSSSQGRRWFRGKKIL